MSAFSLKAIPTLLVLTPSLALAQTSPGLRGVPDSLLMFDLEQGEEQVEIIAHDSMTSVIGDEGSRQLLVETKGPSGGPGVTLKKPTGSWDLDPYYHVKMDITNAGEHPVKIVFKVGNPEDGMEAWQMEIRFPLKPGETRTVADDIATTRWRFSEPFELVGMRAAPGQAKTDLTAIDRVKVSIQRPTKPHKLIIDNIRATNPVRWVSPEGYLPFVDRFGQYRHADWPGKTYSVDDLRQQAEEEERYLTDNPAPKNFSKFGGWKDGPKFEATGFFRTQKHEGVWWLVDPEGYLFWSHGVGCVHPATAKTGTTDRESYFEWLPEKDSDFGKFYNTLDGASHGYYKGRGEREVYNFTASNLYQKFGENWYDEFSRVTHARLRSWGMNTMAIASDKKLCEQGLTPYTETVWVKETRKIEASTGYWGGFHDVFDPDFRNKVREALASRKRAGSDPWCLGFFIENELSWGTKGSLATATLESPADQPAKQVFLADLKAKYDTIESLNESWETEHASWDALLESTEAPDSAKAEEDLNAFYEKIAITYFSTVREEMKAIAPNVMYLGCRLAWAMNDIVLSAAAEYTDVMSKNKYEYGVSDVGLPEGVDHPILIGEFHFGALDRGAMHVGICDATDQFHRAELYTAYLETALRNPFIVGTHWFQYGDQPPTGRGDGENYNVGLVDLCDRPFPEMIRTVSEMGRRFYDFRHDAAVNGGIVEP